MRAERVLGAERLTKVMSGKPPFWGHRNSAIILRIIQAQIPKSEEHPNLPPDDDLWNLIRRCWDTEPTARPTMREVLREVCRISRLEPNAHTEARSPVMGSYFSGKIQSRATLRLPSTAEASGREHSYMSLDVSAYFPLFHRISRFLNTIHLDSNYDSNYSMLRRDRDKFISEP